MRAKSLLLATLLLALTFLSLLIVERARADGIASESVDSPVTPDESRTVLWDTEDDHASGNPSLICRNQSAAEDPWGDEEKTVSTETCQGLEGSRAGVLGEGIHNEQERGLDVHVPLRSDDSADGKEERDKRQAPDGPHVNHGQGDPTHLTWFAEEFAEKATHYGDGVLRLCKGEGGVEPHYTCVYPPDPKILVIHTRTSTPMSQRAALMVMGLINPTFPGYDQEDPRTWAVNFQVRSLNQVQDTSSEDLRKLFSEADVVIIHSGMGAGGTKIHNLLTETPDIATNRPGKILLFLDDGTVDYLLWSTAGGVRLFKGIPRTDVERIMNDFRNGDIAKLENWKRTYPQLSLWLEVALYQSAKGIPNYYCMYLHVLKKYGELSGGDWEAAWRPEWDPTPYTVIPNEFLYRDGRIFLTIEEYLASYPMDPTRPTVGVVDNTTQVLAGNTGHYEAMIKELADRGMNVIPVIGAYSGTAAGRPNNIYSAMVRFFTNAPSAAAFEADPYLYRSRIDALVSFFFFTLGSGFVEQTARLLEYLDVPVFRAMVTTRRSLGEWLISDDGFLWSDTYYQIAIPESQGIIMPMLVATTDRGFDPVTGAELVCYVPVSERLEKFADRVGNWVRLRYLDNKDKKVAVVYYNYPPGRDNIGASYLNVPDTVFRILMRLTSEGYGVQGMPGSAEELLDLMLLHGVNVAPWAPGTLQEMASTGKVILWEAEEYYRWFQGLHPMARKQVVEGPVGYVEEVVRTGVELGLDDEMVRSTLLKTVERWTKEMRGLLGTLQEESPRVLALLETMSEALLRVIEGSDLEEGWEAFCRAKTDFLSVRIPGLSGWGEPPGDIMTVTLEGRKYLVIPGILMGNVFVGPEPQRARERNLASAFLHSPIVPPHHQYLAWYAWVNTVFGAHAQVHVGRHATYEWLPRKQVALSAFDYSDIVVADVPSVYLYIMDGVGEGLQAKRRGMAVIVDHLTPPMVLTELYGGFLELKALVEDYQAAASVGNQAMMGEYARAIRSKVQELRLEGELGVDVGTAEDENLVEAVEDFLRLIMNTLLPYGLHTVGQPWSQQEVALLSLSMVSPDGGPSSPSLQRLLAQSLGWDYDRLTLTQAERVNGLALDMVRGLVTGEVSLDELTSETRIRAKLAEALDYARKIMASFSLEMDALMEALIGRFITPATGNDPVRNPNALPTGRNFYSTSEQLLPTAVAWDLGKRLADLALARMDRIPDKVAAVVWCVETVRDNGTMVSFVLRMMGIEPERTSGWLRGGSAGRMVATPLPTLLSDLNAVRANLGLPPLPSRPRVDVVVTTSGLFRDLFPRLLVNMDRAVRVAIASSYNVIVALHPSLARSLDTLLSVLVEAQYANFRGSDPLELNLVARHWVETVLELLNQGFEDDLAGELAAVRIFAPPVGDYGAGISHLVEEPWSWESREQLADAYLLRMGYAYSERLWGSMTSDLFHRALQGVEQAFHSRSTNLYGVVDNDDYFDYFGGLFLALERVNGTSPMMSVLYYANPAQAAVVPLASFLGRELRTRYFNPQWIQGMMQEGYSGARTITNKFVSYLWGWEATVPGMVSDWMWEEVVNVYIEDKYGLGILSWLSEGHKAYCLTELTGTLLTVIHKGFWNPDEELLMRLAGLWGRTVAQHGVSCGIYSCGYIEMFRWALRYMDQDLAREVCRRVLAATGNALSEDNPHGQEPAAEEPCVPGSEFPGQQGEQPEPPQAGEEPSSPGSSLPPGGQPTEERPEDEGREQTYPHQRSQNSAPAPSSRWSEARWFHMPVAFLHSTASPAERDEEAQALDNPSPSESEGEREKVRAYEVEKERETTGAGPAFMLLLGMAALVLVGLGGFLLAGRRRI